MWATVSSPESTARSYDARETSSVRAARASSAASRAKSDAGQAAAAARSRPSRLASPERAKRNASIWSASTGCAAARLLAGRGGARLLRVPAVGVLGLVDLLPERREPERTEGVPHDRELVRGLLPEGLLHRPRLRAVRQPGRVQRDASDIHALARRVVTGRVEHDLLGLDVRVVVRQRDRLRVPVEHPRRERADHEVRALEGLVRRRRQVKASGARLEVVSVERVRPDVAVPPDDVERMPVEQVVLEAVPHANGDRELAGVVERLELHGRAEVPLRERRVLEQLAIAVAIAVRGLDLAGGVEADPELLLPVRQLPRVGRAPRDDDVVALAKRHASENGAHHAAPAVDVDDLVALAVAVEAIQLRRRLGDRHLDVAVPHQQPAAGDRVPAGLHRVRVAQPVDVGVRHPLVALDPPKAADPLETAGRLKVQQDRLVPREALVAHDLLHEERRGGAVAVHLNVPLGRNPPESRVAHGLLLALDRLEQGLEIALAKAAGTVAFNDLEEDRRPVADRLREDLQQVALVVAVDQDPEPPQILHVLLDLADPSRHLRVVGVRDREKLDAAVAQP